MVNQANELRSPLNFLTPTAPAVAKSASFAAEIGKHYSVDTANAITTPEVLPSVEIGGIRFTGLTWNAAVIVNFSFYADYGDNGYYTDGNQLYLYGDNTRLLEDIVSNANDSGLVTAELITLGTGGNAVGDIEGSDSLAGGSQASTTYTPVNIALPASTGSRAVIQFSDARASFGVNGPYFEPVIGDAINRILGTKRITTPALLLTFVDVGEPDGWRVYTGVSVPENSVRPAITGEATEYSTLTCLQGTWTNAPTDFSYQWQISADGTTGWADIDGATTANYTVLSEQIGQFLRCSVIATSAAGDSEPAYSLAAGPITEVTLLTGLISHWKLDEASGARADSHGGYTLSDVNGAVSGPGKIGNCAAFAGGSALAATPPPWSGPALNALSVSYWVKYEYQTGGFSAYSLPFAFFPAGTTGSAGIGGFIAASDATAHPQGCVAVDMVRPDMTDMLLRLQGPTRIDDGQWHHVAASFDGTVGKLFIDGVLEVTESEPNTGGTPADGVYLYLNGGGGFGTTDVSMDSVSVWSRALSDGEISALYNGGDGLDYESF